MASLGVREESAVSKPVTLDFQGIRNVLFLKLVRGDPSMHLFFIYFLNSQVYDIDSLVNIFQNLEK